LSITTIWPRSSVGHRKCSTLEQEGIPIYGALYAHRGAHPFQVHRGDQRDVLVPVFGHLAQSSLTFRCPRPQRNPLSGTIYARWSSTPPRRQASWGLHATQAASPSTSLSLLHFARWHPASFFVGPAELVAYSPAHCGNRETLTPCFCFHSSQWRSRVASSLFSSCSHSSARFSSAVARMRRLRPVEGRGSRSSPALRRFM
jgi:hypothetical protein